MISNITINPHWEWLLELLYKIIDGARLPVINVNMLSSRESGKSHVLERFFMLALLQQSRRTVLYLFRARNADCKKTIKSFESIINEYHGGSGVFINYGDMTITAGKNILYFITLNEEKHKVNKTGGKIGLPIQYFAEYSIAWFEEASQLNLDLVQNIKQSFRANKATEFLTFYTSNPWNKTHWFVEDFVKAIKEDEEHIRRLETRGWDSKFDERTKTLYFKPRYTLNPYIKQHKIAEMEALKDINYKKWQIVSMGLSGSLLGNLYQESLKKLKRPLPLSENHTIYGGIDWADGKSATASATSAYICGIDENSGIDIYGEYWRKENRGKSYNTEQKIQELVRFYIKWYEKINQNRPIHNHKNITIFLDNQALGDFWMLFQRVSEREGYPSSKLEFLPAFKPKNIWERVEFVSAAIAMGLIRFDKNELNKLYEAYDNCYEVTKTSPNETTKRERSHEWTDPIVAVEYMIGANMKIFQSMFPIITTNKSIGNLV